MSTKSKTNSKSKSKEPEQPKETFSYDFLEMLADTAHNALNEYVQKTKAPEIDKVYKMHETIYSLWIEQAYILVGGGSPASYIYDVVARASMLIFEMGGCFSSPSGDITPLKEWREMIANKAKA